VRNVFNYKIKIKEVKKKLDVISAQVKHSENLLLTARQRGRWVHEEVVIRVARKVFRDPLRTRAFVTRTRINRCTRRAHQAHHSRLMG